VTKCVLVRLLDRETVLLNLETECYYGLDETGTRMWQVFTTASNIDDAYVRLLTEFDADAELLRLDLSKLLDQLVEKGLLRIRPASVA
jgi:coenzyme PQQ synthesis protein D (PqqD)